MTEHSQLAVFAVNIQGDILGSMSGRDTMDFTFGGE